MPSSLAASATAPPWLPDEYATTPAARCAGSSWLIRLNAPRNLNDPPRWNDSAFSSTTPSHREFRVAEVSSGVRWATPASLAAAARMFPRVRSSVQMAASWHRLMAGNVCLSTTPLAGPAAQETLTGCLLEPRYIR